MIFNLSPEPISLLPLLWLPLLYAETHYRFKYFFSYLRKAEPEIIADCPSRIKKGQDLPILLLVKDADRYPVLLHDLAVFNGDRLLFERKLNRPAGSSYEEIISGLPAYNMESGNLLLNIRITYQCRGKTRICWNDNHRSSSHAPLPLYVSDHDLPRLDNCLYGETHAHTIYTSDQVEFGASLAATAHLAAAMGLDFFCATDHSYDLDDRPDDYLHNDPEVAKWRQFRSEAGDFNRSHTFKIIPGEEVTVRNIKGRNVHCLVYNSPVYFPGSGDSAEKWLHTRSEMSIAELLTKLPDGTLALAAHPAEKPPLLQRLLIRRGHWHPADCDHADLHGLQFINHSGSATDDRGKQLWIGQLLKGYRQTGLAGNDAHGNFARFRQIGIPFLTMRENYLHLFGHWRLGVYTDAGRKGMDDILAAIVLGACFMTDGPALLLQAFGTAAGAGEKSWHHTGRQIQNVTRLKIAAASTPEFSALKNIKVFSSSPGAGREELIFNHDLDPDCYDCREEIDFSGGDHGGYVRVELSTESGKTALSNPIWILV